MPNLFITIRLSNSRVIRFIGIRPHSAHSLRYSALVRHRNQFRRFQLRMKAAEQFLADLAGRRRQNDGGDEKAIESAKPTHLAAASFN